MAHKKQKKVGSLGFLVRNENGYVRQEEIRAETRSPAGGTKTNWTKTKAAP